MTYPKQRKQSSKLFKKNKTKVRKTKGQNKRTRRFRKQYGGKLNEEQIEYIQKQIKDLGFSDEEIMELLLRLNEISQPLSKQSYPRIPNARIKTVLDSFFANIDVNYQHHPDLKQEVFREGAFRIYNRNKNLEPGTDTEDKDED